jgi:hypothetical protein
MGYAETNHSDEAMPNFSPAHLTTLSLAPPEMIRVAGRCACSAVGLRLIQVTPDSPVYPLMTDPAMPRKTPQATGRRGFRLRGKCR